MSTTGGIFRVVALIVLAVAFWFAGRVFDGLPTPLDAKAPATEFSAARASGTLGRLLGPEVPHPVSSPANAAVRDRVRAEFAALGITTQIYKANGCNGRATFGFFACGTVEDVIAEVVPGQGKAIILLAHYDSVPAGPGAADDQSGVATILETVRALKARGLKSKHPIIALISDGEEAGLLGAAAFVDDPKWRDRVGVVVNVEARGNRGPSLLFQTSAGDGALIDLYANSAPTLATSSLFAVIYKALPNDTDLTVFLNKGLTGINFAFSGNVAHYHTPLDLRANIDPATLQMHGNSLLSVTSSLMQTDYKALESSNAVYVTLLGHFLPRMPAFWALPLAILTLALVIGAAFLSQGEVLGIGRRIAAFAIPLLALLGAAAFGWVLHTAASLVSGQPDPSYATPLWLRIALAFGVLTAILLVSRLASARLTALAVWGWMAVLAVVTAAFLPGLSPYFLFPALIGSVLLIAQSRLRGAWTGGIGEVAMLVAALLPLLIWMSLAAAAEAVQGLALHPLATIPMAFGAMTLLPLLAARPLSRQTWMRLSGGAAAVALVIAIVAGLQPAYTQASPQRLNLAWVDDHVANRGLWNADTGAPLPPSLRAAAPWRDERELPTPVAFQKSFVAPAGATRFAVPTADITTANTGAGRTVMLTMHASAEASRVVVLVPKDAALTAITLNGKSFTLAAETLNPRGTLVACVTRDCANAMFTLTFANRTPVDLLVAEQRSGLPPDGAKLAKARPSNATAHQIGDTTIVFGKLRVP